MSTHSAGPSRGRLAALSLAALGVVYGDIGTSPLYALRECFDPHHGLAATPTHVLGVLSLILWALTLVVSVKYLTFVLRAGNKGEGGILALLALAFPEPAGHQPRSRLAVGMVVLGLVGASLLYGDGVLTPAVTVLGAVEGLRVATTALDAWVVPISVGILVGIFAVQRVGTGAVGRVFGPITLVWFLAIAALGIHGILRAPGILQAINPVHAWEFIAVHKYASLLTLGSVVLVVTGAEALYADMGHFGASPIRWAWFVVVFPALVLNYLGQGSLLLNDPSLVSHPDFNPFFQLCPRWSLYPMVGLATMAAVIASQALISGAFSLTMQAVQLGYLPRLVIEHTSAKERGQIYMPQVNMALLIVCVALVLEFRSSSALANAYAVAVTLTMIITTILFFFAAQRLFHWRAWQAGLFTLAALMVELPLAFANLLKIPQGGWFPLVVAGGIFAIMSTWKRGRELIWQRLRSSAVPLQEFVANLAQRSPHRVTGTAVYMAGNGEAAPIALLHNLKHNKVLHERIVVLTIVLREVPHVRDEERVSVEELNGGFWRARACYGFFEEPDMNDVLTRCGDLGLKFRPMETTFFLSRETVVAKDESTGLAFWRRRLFAILSRNATSATAYFRLPANRVIELGMQVEI